MPRSDGVTSDWPTAKRLARAHAGFSEISFANRGCFIGSIMRRLF